VTTADEYIAQHGARYKRIGPYWETGFDNVGINSDGSLHNPNGYPEEEVRDVVTKALQKYLDCRSSRAKRAAETRRRRVELRVHAAAQRMLEQKQIGPRGASCICARGMSDQVSIGRGIEPECWSRVLDRITTIKQEIVKADWKIMQHLDGEIV
jgi:hypothetical protein